MAEPGWNAPPTRPIPTQIRPAAPPRRRPSLTRVAAVGLVVLLAVLSLAGVGWAVFRTGAGVASSPSDSSGVVASRTGLATGAGSSPTAPSASGNVQEVVISLSEAEAVLQSYWSAHDDALIARDLHQLGTLSTGSARRWERGAIACGCYRLTSARPLQETAFFVPRQTRYPAYFIVEVQTEQKNTPWAELLVFTKQTPGEGWLVVHDSGFGPPAGEQAQLGAPKTRAGGFTVSIRSATTAIQRRRARAAAANLAEFWRLAKEQGRVPDSTEFDVSGQTRSRAQRIAQNRQDQIQVNGYRGHFRFFVDPDDARFQVAEAAGTLMSCQPVRETVVYRSVRNGGLIRQDEAQETWGTLLEPGSYRTVTTTDYWQTCFLVPRAPDQPITVLNHDVGGSIPQGKK